MTIPQWVLLGFATWTVLLLSATVGIYRWSRILTGRVPIGDFRADRVEGAGWYQRAMRAHANCIENLPVFGAIVLVLSVSGVGGPAINYLSISVLIARVIQSLIHVCFKQTNTVVSMRFSFFSVQLVSFLVLIVMIVSRTGLKP
ncbi:MAG TPA: MAPEG family protein [Burkholderiales bacterium]|nr:MAPEG family protein [Burkholderiales bacterium]